MKTLNKLELSLYSISGGVSKKGPGGKQIPASYLFRSKDLKHWEYLHDFLEGNQFTEIGDDLACPYFWPIGDRWILPFYSHMSGGQYFLGDYDKARDKFVVANHGKFNFGASKPAGVHAPSATPDGNGGVIILFNMNDAKPTKGWNQLMSLPRRLTLVGEETLMQEPAGDVESLQYDRKVVPAQTLPAKQEVVLKDIQGNAMEIIAEIDTKNAPMVELNVLRSPEKEEYTRISFYRDRYDEKHHKDLTLSAGDDLLVEGFDSDCAEIKLRLEPENASRFGFKRFSSPDGEEETIITYDRNKQRFVIDFEKASLSEVEYDLGRAHPNLKRGTLKQTIPFALPDNGSLDVDIFIDRSILEIFVNSKVCLVQRVYPTRVDSNQFRLFSEDGRVKASQLIKWEMDATNPW